MPNVQVPYSLETTDRQRLAPILERFSVEFPFPVALITRDGTILDSTAPLDGDEADIAFLVDNTKPRVGAWARADLPEGIEVVSAPIRVHDDVLGYVAGTIAREADGERAYAPKLDLLAAFLSDTVYAEYELQNLTEELLGKYSEITLIYDISEALSAKLDRRTVCEFIIQQIVQVVGVGRASIMLYDETVHLLYIEASHGLNLSKEVEQAIRVAPNEKISGKVFSTGQHILIENVREVSKEELPLSPEEYDHPPENNSFLCIPIIWNSANQERKVLGVINMTDKSGDKVFTTNDLRLLTAIASQAAMALYNIQLNNQLIEEAKVNERFKVEIEVAEKVQSSLLPDRPPGIAGLDLAGRCLPATQVGGDYYDFFVHSDTQVGIVIADVSGHDVGSAIIMATARGTLRSEVMARKSPGNILKDTNLMLYNDLGRAEKFITMFYAEYDSGTRELRFSNAAQNPPLLVRDGHCTPLETADTVIGMEEYMEFEEKTIHLLPDDFVILYTDGVVEAKNRDNVMFGEAQLLDILESTSVAATAEQLLETVYGRVSQFSKQADQSDDITVVVLKVQHAAS